ncbi:hypothetical protein, partial [Vulcanococcus sp. DEBay_Sum29NL08_54]|uniref:hypothetical protein n=1 Tax=Vulcanococcus sp. DEBay_Sum29NL08_54 TaxID=2806303 RepID=UPI0025E569A5
AEAPWRCWRVVVMSTGKKGSTASRQSGDAKRPMRAVAPELMGTDPLKGTLLVIVPNDHSNKET